MSKVKLKEVLSREIKNKNMNISQFAKNCGVPKSTLHDWLNGRVPNSKNIDLLKELSKYLGISVEMLLFNEELDQAKSEILFSSVFKDKDKTYRLTIERVK